MVVVSGSSKESFSHARAEIGCLSAVGCRLLAALVLLLSFCPPLLYAKEYILKDSTGIVGYL